MVDLFYVNYNSSLWVSHIARILNKSLVHCCLHNFQPEAKVLLGVF